MEGYLWWVIAGMALIISELVTGTFYLLVIGVAGLAGAGVSYLNYSFGAQAVVALAVATVGVVTVMHFHSAKPGADGASLDVGQSVVLDSWIGEKERLARVRYRNSLWDAKVLDETAVDSGQVLYIQKVDGNTLYVAKSRSA